MRLTVMVACFVLAIPTANAQTPATAPPATETANLELIQLRLEKLLDAQAEKDRQELNARLDSEIKGHREYLQALDDKFYTRLSIWVPVISGIGLAIVGVFMWQFGKTRKEALDLARAEAVSVATALAVEKVKAILIPEDLYKKAEATNTEILSNITQLRDASIQTVESELRQTRDEIVSNKYQLINETLDEALRTNFRSELDVLAKLDALRSENKSLVKRMALLEKAAADKRDIRDDEKALIRILFSALNGPLAFTAPIETAMDAYAGVLTKWRSTFLGRKKDSDRPSPRTSDPADSSGA